MNARKYSTIVETLKAEILSGKYCLSKPFPSIRALIRRFKVSDTTVLHAFDELAHQGLISRSQGRGTFVTPKGVSRKIGLIVPGVAYSEYFSRIVSAISRVANEERYLLLLGDMSSSCVEERVEKTKAFVDELVRENVAGVIYQPFEFFDQSDRFNREVVSILDNAGIAVVLLDYDIEQPPERSKFDIVGINNLEAGYRLGKHLLSVGAHTIDFLLRPNSAPSGRNRLRGLTIAVGESLGLGRLRILQAEPDDVGALKRHLKHGKPDAFVCGGDVSAARFKQTLEQLEVNVPQDVLLAGFNDLQIASLLTPPLTTIHQPCEQIGEMAFRRLLARIAEPGEPPLELYLPAPLVMRESTQRARSVKFPKMRERKG